MSPGSLPLLLLIVAVLIAVSSVTVNAGPGGSVHNLNKVTDYTTIAAAVADANNGDTIQVDSGTYLENNIEILKQITLIGSGPTKPVIDGQANNGITVSSPGVQISGINVTNCNKGIIVNANSVQIIDTNVTNCYQGIYFNYDMSYSEIRGCNVTGCSNAGIYLYYADGNILRNNNVTSCGGTGIYLYYAGDNNVLNNCLTFDNIGLLFEYANYNTVVGNNVSGNAYRGIRFRNDGKYNEIYQNIFINNYQDVDYNYNNYWNSLSALSYVYRGVTYTNKTGNYWFNYNGKDTNQDGIGDTPKVVYYGDGSNIYDNYPMILDIPVPPKADFTMNVTCGNAPFGVQFTDLSTGDPTSWHWEFGDGATADEKNSTHTYTTPGTYLVNLTVTNALGTNTKKMESMSVCMMVLRPLPSPLTMVWSKTYTPSGGAKSNGLDVARTSDNGFVLVGQTPVSDGTARLVKANASGTKVWDQVYTGSGLIRGYSILPETDGGITFTGSNTSYNLTITHTAADGSIVWSTALPYAKGLAPGIAHTADGGYIITSYQPFPWYSSRDRYWFSYDNVYLAKLSSGGALIWNNTFGTFTTSVGWGDPYHAMSYGIAARETGSGYLVVGQLDIIGVGTDLYLAGTDSAGNMLWNKTWGIPGYGEAGCTLLPTDDGNYLVAGNSWIPGATDAEKQCNVMLMKVSSGGDVLWTQNYTGYGYRSGGETVIPDGNGGYVIAGYTQTPDKINRPYLVDVDANGAEQWEAVLPVSLYEHLGIAATGDGGFVVGGGAGSMMSGNCDAFLMKIGAGAVRPTIQFSSPSATGNEGATVHINMFRSGDTSLESSVLVSDIGGTAIRNKNYTFMPVRITFEAGNAYSGFDVALPANNVTEPRDTYVNFSLSSPVNGNIGSQQLFNLTIHDTTPPQVSTQLQWIRTYPLNGYSSTSGYGLIGTADGGYALAGDVTEMWYTKPLLLKADANGAMAWDKVYGMGSGCEVLQESDGGYVFTGRDYNGMLMVTRTYPNGSVMWTYATTDVIAARSSIAPAADGYFVSGAKSMDHSVVNAYVIKLNRDGTRAWDQTTGGGSVNLGWSTYYIKSAAYSVWPTSDGGCILAGYIDPLGLAEDLFISKISATGGVEWSNKFGRDSHYDEAFAVLQASDGGYVAAGLKTDDSGIGDVRKVWLLKTYSNGAGQWDRVFNVSNYRNQADSLITTDDGGYLLAGQTENESGISRPYLIKVNTSGIKEWETALNLSITGRLSVLPAGGSDYVIGGTTRNPDTGITEAFIAKLTVETTTPTSPRIKFSTSAATANEGTTAHVMLSRTGDTDSVCSVHVAVTGGSASSSDYTMATTTATFAAGISSQSIDIDLAADHTTEGPETLVLGLSSPSGATIGTPSTFTLTINDTSRVAESTPPVTSCTLTGTEGLGDWYTSSVTVDLDATDAGGSGVASVSYKLDSAAWVTASGSHVSFTISTNGIHTLLYNGTDLEGNREAAHTKKITINKLLYPVSILPRDEATDVSLYPQVRVTFNALIGLAPVTITLEDPEGHEVSGVVSRSGKVLTFTPRDPLAGLTTYTATVRSTDRSVPLAYSWDFTTMAPDEASIVAIDGPNTLVIDEEHLQPFALTVTVKNTGLEAWKAGNQLTYFNAYKFGDYWNANNTPKYPNEFYGWTFQLTSSPSSPVGPGQNATYTFSVTPTTEEYGNLSVGLWMRASNGNYFGDMAVYHPNVRRPDLGATILKIEGPEEMYYNPDPEHLYSDPDYHPSYLLNITVKNTGETNWPLGYSLTFYNPLQDPSETNAYLSSPQSPNRFMDWTIVPTSSPSSLVRPGDSVTYTYRVYPERPTRSTWKIGFWMSDSYGYCFGNKSYWASRLYAASNDASVVSVSCQPQMLAEREYQVTVRMENTGQMAWLPGYDLMCFDPATTSPWEITRNSFKDWVVEPIAAPAGKVNPGETGTYTYIVVPGIAAIGPVGPGFTMSDLLNNNFGEVAYAYTMINRSRSAPLITAVTPANGSVGVDPRAYIEVTFDRVMDAESLRTAFRVTDDADSRIRGAISYDGSAVRFTPEDKLDFSRTYRVTINGARDRNGYLAPGPYTWQFNTTDRNAVVQFHAASAFAEFGDTVRIVVDRTGDTAGTTTCVVSTQFAYSGFTFNPGLPATLTFAPGETSKTIDFSTDSEFPTTMATQSYITLSDVRGGRPGPQQRFNLTVPRTLISLSGKYVAPGETGYISVKRTGDVSGTSSCTLTLGTGTTAEAYRYVSLMPVTVTFSPGETEKKVAVINAIDRESTSSDYYLPVIQVNATGATGATILGAPYNYAHLTLLEKDMDTHYGFLGSAITINEGSELLLTLQRRNCNLSYYDYCDVYIINQTTYPNDYQANVPGQFRFEPGQSELPIVVHVGQDGDSEGMEYIVLGIREEPNARYKINIVDTSAGSRLEIQGPAEGWEGDTVPLQITRALGYDTQSSCVLSVVGGSASSPEDYTMPAPAIITFPADTSRGEPSRKQYVNIALVPDGLATGDKTIVFKLTDIVNGIAIGGPFTFTIRDTDSCHIGFNVTGMDVGEGDIVRLNLTREGGDLSQPSSCVLSLKEGTVSPADYSSALPLPATITFGPGETVKTVDVTLAADHITEGVEFATFNLSEFDNALPNKNETLLQIRDNSVYPTHIRFYKATSLIYNTYLTVENGGPFMWEGETSHIKLIRTGDISGTSSCVVSWVGGTAEAREFQATLPATITFGPGETEKTVDITVLHTSYKNGIAALSNSIELGLSNPVNTDLPHDEYTGRILNESYYLIDTDSQPYVGYSGTNVTTNEGSTVNLKVKLHYLGTNTFYRDFGISKYNPCTADASDYTLNGPFTFAGASTEVTAPVTIVADHVGEGDETLLLKIGSNSLATTYDNGYLINILDTSSDGTMPAVTAATPANNAIDISPSSPGISATFNKYMDQATVKGGFILRDSMNRRIAGVVTYSDSTRTAVFKPNQSLASGATYTAYLTGLRDLDDNILATYTWRFTTERAPVVPVMPAVVSTSPANGTLDTPRAADITVTFNKTIVAASFQLNDSLGLPVDGATAIADRVLTFTPDAPLASEEEYNATVSGVIDAEGYHMTGSYRFTFTTGGLPAIAFTAAAQTANEGTTTHVMMFRSGDTSIESSVLVSNVSGTAVAGKNYTFKPVRITFEAGQEYAGFDVGLPSNSVNEPIDTYVNFSLSAPINATMGDLVNFNLTIHDATVPVVVATYPLNDTAGCIAGTIPAVTFSKPMANVTFQLKDKNSGVVAGTALIDGAYFTYAPATPLNYGERYWATVLDATDSGGRHIAAPCAFTFVIGSAPVLSLSASSATVNEGSGYELFVVRTGDLTGVSTCFVEGGNGLAGNADYSTSPWLPKTFTFGAGEARKYINFSTVADNLTEGSESVSYGINYVNGGTRGTPYSFTLSISDTSRTPETISFTKPGYMAFAGTTTQVLVKRTGNKQPSAMIQIGGNAVEGRDFTVTKKQVNITYTDYDDFFVTVSANVTGLDKYVNFTLTDIIGADSSYQSTYNLTLAGASYIPKIQFASASGRIEEGGALTLNVTRTGLLDVDSQFQVYGNGTADWHDYTSSPSLGGWLTMLSGVSSQYITIYGTQDYVTEGTETMTFWLVPRSNIAIGSQSTFVLTFNDTTTNFTKPIRNMRTWTVYTNLTKAISEAAKGDIVEIDSGTYSVDSLDLNGISLAGRDTGRGRPLIVTSGTSNLINASIDGVDFDSSGISTVFAESVLKVDGSWATVKNCNINSSGMCIYKYGYNGDDGLRLTIENCDLVGGGHCSINYNIGSEATGSTVIRNSAISGAGIRFSWAHNIMIDRCVLSGVNLVLSGTDGNTIRDSRIIDGEIQLLGGHTTVISNVASLHSPGIGLLADGTYDLSMIGLIVSDPVTGIKLVDINRNATIADSVIARADGDGLLLDNSEHLAVINNSLIDCTTGVQLMAGSGNNTFYLNQFASVTNAVQVNTTNMWSSYAQLTYQYAGKTFTGNVGNQWNNYPGTDANGDGIGDTPYFSGTIRDNYPLARGAAISFTDQGPRVTSVYWGWSSPDNFLVDDWIQFYLDRDVRESSFSGISLKDSSNRNVPIDIHYINDFYGNSWEYRIVVKPTNNLNYGETYTVTLSGLTDLAGRVMASPYAVSFKTQSNSLAVVSVSPPDGWPEVHSAYGSFVYNPIKIEFNRPIETITKDDVTAGKIRLLDDALQPTYITVAGYGKTLEIRPSVYLKNATVYTIEISGLQDENGSAMASKFQSRFITWGNPKVVGTTPADKATNMPVNQPVFVYFDKPLNPGTINSIAIKDSGGNKVSTSVGYLPYGSGKGDGSASSVLIGHNNFSYSADYTIEITGVADVPGNTMKYVERMTFRTADQPYIGSVSPAGAAIDVPRATTITATFSKDMDPASIQSGFTLRDASGNNIAGTVTYDSATRTATFRPASLLAYGALYSAHVVGARDTAGNSLTGYNWGFTTIRAPISVLSVTPANGAMDQPTTTVITATFSDDMDDWTVINGFTVVQFNGGTIPGTVTYDAAARKATFRPSAGLNANGNMYTVTLSGMVGTHSGVMSDYTWNFRTLWRKPTVTSTSPASGASGVSPNATITVTFSESMDPESLRTGFKLRDNLNNNVAGGVTSSGNTATFTPAAPLNGGEHYTVYLLSLAGLQKNTMPDYAFEFTVIHKIEPIPTSDLGGTPRPSLIPTPTPTPPFQTTLNGLGVTVSGDRITAPAGTDISRFLTNGGVTIPAGSGKLRVDIDVGSLKNTGTITGVHISDQSSGTANGGTATVSVTADLDGMPSGSVTFSATVSDPTPADISAAREWTGSRSRSLVNALALIDVQKSGFTNDDIVDGTAKITLTVKKPADFSLTKTYTVIRHGDNGYEELTATYKSETADTVTFEILSPNGFSTFLLAETVAATTPTAIVKPPVSPTPVPGPGFLLIGLAVVAGAMIIRRVRQK